MRLDLVAVDSAGVVITDLLEVRTLVDEDGNPSWEISNNTSEEINIIRLQIVGTKVDG